jgi:hypothetical protein
MLHSLRTISLGLWLGCLIFAGDAPAQSQLEVRTSNVSQLAGADGLRTIGDVVLLTNTDELAFTPGVLIEVTSPAANVEIEVTDRDRRRVDFVALAHENGTTFYLVTTQGKSWVDVTAIDFAQNIYKRSTGNVIDVGKSPTPGPTPTPVPVVPEPSESLRGLAQPIVEKLANDKAKAGQVATTFAGFSDAIRVVPIDSVAKFANVTGSAIKTLGISPGNPIGQDIDDLLATHMGVSRNAERKWLDRPLTQADRDKAAEAFMAVAWAGAQVK